MKKAIKMIAGACAAAVVCSVALMELLRRPLTRAGVFDRLNGR